MTNGLWCLLHLLLAAVSTWVLRRYALGRQLVDLPGERRSHQVPTPRGGGMAIVVAVLAGLAYAALVFPLPIAMTLGGFAVGLVCVAGIGWWDDHRPLSASLRLLVHVAAGLWLGLVFWRVGGSFTIALIVACAAVVLVNVWNFMDGINGLAASQALIAAVGFALALPPHVAFVAWGVAAACAGFLPFNFPHARIFLGDGGSGALGYLMALLLGLVLQQGFFAFPDDVVLSITQRLWPLAILPLSAFLVDAGFTLASRMLARERWWEPHSQHVYQRLARRLGGHTLVTLAYACFSVAAVILHLRLQAALSHWSALAVTLWLSGAAALWLLLRNGLRNH